jgi:exopolysaccharide biosynthesis polyprenyl glycosylphosphotransferase
MSEQVAVIDRPIPTSLAVPHSLLRQLPPDWLPVALLLSDAVIAALSVPAGFWVRYGTAAHPQPWGPYVAAIPVVALLYVFALSVTSQYSSWRGRTLMDKLLLLYCGIALAAVLMLAIIELGYLGQVYSRLAILSSLLISAAAMTGLRVVLRVSEMWLRRRGIGNERILMVGTGRASEILIRRVTMFPQYGFQVVGVACDESAPGTTFTGMPVVGQINDMAQLVVDLKVDQVFLALSAAQRDRLSPLIKTCEDQKVEYKIVPDLLDEMSTRVMANAIDGVPLVGTRQSRLKGDAAVVKRAIDLTLSFILLVVFSPLMFLVAILIKLTMPGPVFFRQQRIGLGGHPFVIFKFRSMIRDAEAQSGPTVAMPGDSRVTPFGRILRRLSLDELPQLFNVLRGDMSLVGPRPQPAFFDERYSRQVPRYQERQQVRPGLTGWAEVNDLRGAAPIVDRTMYDIYYVENWSLVLDLKCVLLTAIRVFAQRHAY